MINDRLVRSAVWLLAVILPGGLILLAMWTAVRALRARGLKERGASQLRSSSLASVVPTTVGASTQRVSLART